MEDHCVAPRTQAPRTQREDSTVSGHPLACTYWLDQALVPEAAFWEAMYTRGSSDGNHSQIEALLSAARKVSGMDSTFLVRENAIMHCVNRGPLKLVAGQSLEWFDMVGEELVAAESWQTHALNRERVDAPPGLPLRVKTLFALPVNLSSADAAVMLCGISQMRVVMDGTQMAALKQLSGRLQPLVNGGTDAAGTHGGRCVSTISGSGKARKPGRGTVFAHVFGGRGTDTKRSVGA